MLVFVLSLPQIDRKRHIGNDIVNVVFIDTDEPRDAAAFKPSLIRSNFTHVYAVVCLCAGAYHLSVFSVKSVPPFGPSLPTPAVFKDHAEFRRFLLVKLINGEKAT